MQEYVPDPDEIVELPADNLLLDTKNPRLAWRVEGKDVNQKSLLEMLWREMAVDELVMSIGENGFFQSEPLFVIPEDDKNKLNENTDFIVVEGNRRLAAVRILRNDKLRKELDAEDLPYLSEDTKLDRIPSIIYPDRESLWETVGFRHINGIKQWDSFSKAQYISEVHDEYGESLEKMAEKIGDNHSTVKRIYSGFKVLEQAENEGLFDRDNTYKSSLYFSHLYTAIDQNGYRKFLGIDSDGILGDEPVDEENLDRLEELLEWIYGRKDENISPVVKTQKPDLRKLRKVIQDPESLSVLRSSGSLDEAYESAMGEEKLFDEHLVKAKTNLKKSKSNLVGGYSGEKRLLDTIKEIVEISYSMYEEMEKIRKTKVSHKEESAIEKLRKNG